MKQTRHYRRILAAILAVVLTVGMSLTAFAAPGDSSVDDKDKGSITITNPKDNATYYGYKIFDVTYAKAGDKKSYSYTIASDSAWYSIVNTYATTDNGLSLVKAAGADEYVVNITDGVFSAADFAKHLKDNVGSIAKDFTLGPKGESETELKKENLELGYYFVMSEVEDAEGHTTTQALCNLTTTNPDAEIKDKNDTEFTKEISEIDSSAITGTDPVTNQDVQVGSVVTYTIKGDIPDRSGADTYYYHAKDTMSKGLAFQKPVTVKIGTAEIELATVTEFTDATEGNKIKYNDPGDANGGGFELSLDLMEKNGENFKYADGDKIVITYKAVVTVDAVEQIGENEAILKYGTDPDDLAESTPQKVKTWSSKIQVNKYEDNGNGVADETKPLNGAKFVLRKKDSTAYYAAKKLVTEGETTKYELMTSTDTVPLSTTATDDLAKVEWETDIDLDNPESLNKITVLTTGDLELGGETVSGKAIFAGLANGVYELIEVEAPAGYNLLEAPTTVELFTVATEDATGNLVVKTGTIEEEDLQAKAKAGVTLENYTEQTVEATVLNKSGSFLPSTGGIGTTIFYVLGSVLLVVAAAWFVISRRKVQIEEK